MTLATDRGDTGFSTLVVLIALLLAVAIAIGLLFNTVAVLHNQDDGTHDSALDEQVQILATETTLNDPAEDAVMVSDRMADRGDPIGYELRLELTPKQDVNSLNLTDLRIDIERDGVTATLRHVSTVVESGELVPDGTVDETPVAQNVFFIQPRAVESVDGTITAAGDRYKLVIPTGVFLDGDGVYRPTATSDARVTPPRLDVADDIDVVTDVVTVLDADEGIDNSGLRFLSANDDLSVTIRDASESESALTAEFRLPSDLSTAAGQTVPL